MTRLEKIKQYVYVYIIMTILFSTLMVITYLLPNDSIRKHIEESILYIERGQLVGILKPAAVVDTYTDALIFNIAYNKGMDEHQNALIRAFENSLYSSEDGSNTTALKMFQENENMHNNQDYARYWHGIQTIIRPLLLIFNYSEIRYIMMTIMTMMLAITFYTLGKNLGKRFIICFALVISFMYIVTIQMCMQYMPAFIISLIAMNIVCWLISKKKTNLLPIFFFIIGGMTTFFDLLTYPLITLGFPLIIVILMQNRNHQTLKGQLQILFKLIIAWGIGYGLLFVTKWILASIVLQKNIIWSSLEQFLFRVNGNEQYPVHRMTILYENWRYYFTPIVDCINILVLLFWIPSFIYARKEKQQLTYILPFIIIMIMPYVWYLILAGHSSIHCWFTNRIQAITELAILVGFTESIDKEKIKIERKGKNENSSTNTML